MFQPATSGGAGTVLVRPPASSARECHRAPGVASGNTATHVDSPRRRGVVSSHRETTVRLSGPAAGVRGGA